MADSTSEQQTAFRVGDRIEAKYRGRAKRYYKGEISAVYPDGGTFSYDIKYDDGDKDKRLPSEFVRKLVSEDSEKPPDEIVLFDNQAGVPLTESDSSGVDLISTSIEVKVKPDKEECVSNNEQEAPSSQAFIVGDRVEARYKGRGTKYYQGIIKAVRPGGSYDVDYDDGDRDRRLSGDFIKRLSSSSNKLPDLDGVSTKQEKQKSISTIQSSVASSSIGSRGSIATSTKTSTAGDGFRAGDNVEALFRGRGSRWYKAIVTNRLPNGCYNVKYAAGDTDLRLPPSAVRAINRPESGPKVVESESTISDSLQMHIDTEKEDGGSSPASEEFVAKGDESESVQDDKPNEVVDADEYGADSHEAKPLEAPIVKDQTSIPSTSDAVDMGVADKTETTDSCKVKKQGRISKISIIHVFEVIYPDGSKDVDVPLEALEFDADSGRSCLNIGTCVDVTL